MDNAPEEISHSLIRTIKTKNGRDVIDGRGIVPDVQLIKKAYSELTSEIIINDLIFEFVNQYVAGIDSISRPEEFELEENVYNDFISYVENRPDFEYSTTVEKKLLEIKEILEKDSAYSDIKSEFLTLEKKLKGDLITDLERYKIEIVPLIENEIVARFYFQKGKTVHSFSFSDAMNQSKRILKSSSEYSKLLNP